MDEFCQPRFARLSRKLCELFSSLMLDRKGLETGVKKTKQHIADGGGESFIHAWCKTVTVDCVSHSPLLLICFGCAFVGKRAGDDAAAAIQVSVGETTNVSDVVPANSAVSAASSPISTASAATSSVTSSLAVLVFCCLTLANCHIGRRWFPFLLYFRNDGNDGK